MSTFVSKKNVILVGISSITPFILLAWEVDAPPEMALFRNLIQLNYHVNFYEYNSPMRAVIWLLFWFGPSAVLLSFTALNWKQKVILFVTFFLLCFPLFIIAVIYAGMLMGAYL